MEAASSEGLFLSKGIVMKAPKIKYLERLSEPKTRKRDGATVTHNLRLHLTTDEALLVSSMFDQIHNEDAEAPTYSLFRSCLTIIAEGRVTTESLVEDMAKWRTREALASALSEADYNRALSYLDSLKKPSPAKNPPSQKKTESLLPPIEKPKKILREFVPEPRRIKPQ